MNSRNDKEWSRWGAFCVRRFREFVFLAGWSLSAWALDHYIVRPLPLSGPPKYMLHVFEGIFNIAALFELVLLLYFPRKPRWLRWLAKR